MSSASISSSCGRFWTSSSVWRNKNPSSSTMDFTWSQGGTVRHRYPRHSPIRFRCIPKHHCGCCFARSAAASTRGPEPGWRRRSECLPGRLFQSRRWTPGSCPDYRRQQSNEPPPRARFEGPTPKIKGSKFRYESVACPVL